MNEVKKELTMIREFDAPAEMLYNAWLNPELVKQWWGPAGVFIPTCELDAKPGGKMYIVMEAGEQMGKFKGTQWPMEGTFVELDKPNKIVFDANAITDGKAVLEHRTTVTIEETGGKTKMTIHVQVTKVLPGSEFAIAGMEQGWNSQFDKLVEFIKKETNK